MTHRGYQPKAADMGSSEPPHQRGSGRFYGRDTGVMVKRLYVSGGCSCGAHFEDDTLAGLRDQLALHVVACAGELPRPQVAKR